MCGQKDIKIVVQNKKGTRLRTSLVGENLPEFDSIKINIDTNQTQDKMILFCFFDMGQRPSRHCIMELGKQADQLKEKGVTVIAIQVSKIDENKHNEWAKNYNIPFPVGMIEDDEEKNRFTWCVKFLPWLILTDHQHVVRAEGFALNELSEKLKQMEGE